MTRQWQSDHGTDGTGPTLEDYTPAYLEGGAIMYFTHSTVKQNKTKQNKKNNKHPRLRISGLLLSLWQQNNKKRCSMSEFSIPKKKKTLLLPLSIGTLFSVAVVMTTAPH